MKTNFKNYKICWPGGVKQLVNGCMWPPGHIHCCQNHNNNNNSIKYNNNNNIRMIGNKKKKDL